MSISSTPASNAPIPADQPGGSAPAAVDLTSLLGLRTGPPASTGPSARPCSRS
uniref:hypothetical protein n=1 Tax=Synechococcus sp. CS-1329 TaxID=2847975 RepID=UPI002880927D|nr:hypothetical protein [Synechococcus sp. CS-1329]